MCNRNLILLLKCDDCIKRHISHIFADYFVRFNSLLSCLSLFYLCVAHANQISLNVSNINNHIADIYILSRQYCYIIIVLLLERIHIFIICSQLIYTWNLSRIKNLSLAFQPSVSTRHASRFCKMRAGLSTKTTSIN